MALLRIGDIIGTSGIAVLHFKRRFGFVVRDMPHVEVKVLLTSAGLLMVKLFERLTIYR